MVPVRACGNQAVASVLDQFTPMIRRLERLRFSSEAGRASGQTHGRLIELCEAGDVQRAGLLAEGIWQALRA